MYTTKTVTSLHYKIRLFALGMVVYKDAEVYIYMHERMRKREIRCICYASKLPLVLG